MSEEAFNANVLPEISPFQIDWANITKNKRSAKGGGSYDTYLLPVVAKGYKNSFQVEVFKTDYDRLRLLRLQGINSYSATNGIAKKEGARAPMIFSGATP